MSKTAVRETADREDVGVVARPRIDVVETENELLVFADLPGVKPEDVSVRFENGELTLHARRTPAHEGKKRALWEYEPTHYHRAFTVSDDLATDRIDAELKDGVLKLTLPKAEAAKPRKIAVKGA